MKAFLSRICFYLLVLTHYQVFATDSLPEYGKRGTFELSMGLSTFSTINDRYYKNFEISLMPYANHFVFDRFFLRYDAGLGTKYYTDQSFRIDLQPGIGIGYSFSVSERWFFNMAVGISTTAELYKSPGLPWNNQNHGNVNIYPELKYLITNKWAASILMRGNFSSILYYEDPNGATLNFTTQTYIVLSYLF